MRRQGCVFGMVLVLGVVVLLESPGVGMEGKVELLGGDMSAWRGKTGAWQVVGDTHKRGDNERLLGGKPGAGVILNGPTGRTVNILSKQEFGDVRAHVEFMVPKGSNSGVYFMARYEIQVFDSWGVAQAKHSDCGGIYQRWDNNRNPKGFEGVGPRVNASRPPGVWQSYDVIFRAPRFDGQGRKIANAKFVKVYHNGILVHENKEVKGPTRASTYNDEKATGPLMLQGDHGPVAYRNIWIAPVESDPFLEYGQGDKVYLTGKDMEVWRGETGDWQVVGNVQKQADNEKLLASTAGTGAILNGAKGKTRNLITKPEFGDVRAHIEFMMAKDSNSGVYFGGQYELQIFDSYGKKGKYPGIECGGIYERWDEKRTPKGFEGHSPRVNASFAPGEWQTFDVVFRAATFDGQGKKIANAKFEKVFHNGKLIHEGVELYGGTRGSMFGEERARGPLLFQGDHGPVAYRNVWVAPIERPDIFLLGTTPERQKLTIKEHVGMLKELGYDGTWHSGCAGVGKMLEELDRQGLRLYAIYTPVHLDGDKPKYEPKMKEAIEALAGRDAILWLNVHSSKYKPSDPAGDGRAVEIIREIAEMAGKKGVKVALYPHHNFWIERAEDSVRVARKVNRGNVGGAFNLCHWMKVTSEDSPEELLKKAGRLSVVSLNGADVGDNWKALIQPLDKGAYEVYGVLKMLKTLEYDGAVGLQVYGIQEEPRDHLGRSIKKWGEFTRRVVYELQ